MRPGGPQTAERSAALLPAPPPGSPPAGRPALSTRAAARSGHEPPARSSWSQSRAAAGPPPLGRAPWLAESRGRRKPAGAQRVPGPPPAQPPASALPRGPPRDSGSPPTPSPEIEGWGAAENRRAEVRVGESSGEAGRRRASGRQRRPRAAPGGPGRPRLPIAGPGGPEAAGRRRALRPRPGAAWRRDPPLPNPLSPLTPGGSGFCSRTRENS